MIGQLLRILKPNSRDRRRHRKWELIGDKAYGHENLERVPSWVKEKIADIYCDGPGSSLGLQTYHLKGKRYRYRLAFSGQGGPILHVYRRKRRQSL